LSGNDNIHDEAHYVASNIPIFLKNAEFACSVDKYKPCPQWSRRDFWTEKRQKI